MVIYCSVTLVVLTHCFARPTGGSLQTVPLLYKKWGKRQTLSLLWPLLGTLLTFCTNYYLHTDQLNIHYENGVTRSFYHTLSTTYFRSTFINRLLFQSV